MKIGFDNQKYLIMQSEHIRERISKFGDKLYLEFGGKLFDDYHASRVLPGFAPDSKLQMLLQLADQAEITMEELKEYPCLSFEQGEYNSFYFAEEVLSTYEYKRLIKANDRATMLNLMVGLNGYTLCSGIICESLNGDDYCAVKLKSDELMTIGYIKRKGVAISPLGEKYLEEIKKYKAMGDDSGYRDIL